MALRAAECWPQASAIRACVPGSLARRRQDERMGTNFRARQMARARIRNPVRFRRGTDELRRPAQQAQGEMEEE